MLSSHETQIPTLEDKNGNIDPKKVKEAYHPGMYFRSETLVRQLLLTHPRTASIAKEMQQEDKNRDRGDQLVDAAFDHNIKLISCLLDENTSPNQRNHNGSNALVTAASRGCIDVVKLLLDHKADVNLSGRIDYQNYGPALVFAAKGGHLEITQLLLDAKADIELKEGYTKRTALDATIDAHFYEGDYHWVTSQIAEDARALDTVLLLLKHHAQIHRSQELLRFLKKCDMQNPNNPKVIDGLEHLCRQLEDRGIQVPKLTKWRHITLFARTPSNDSEVLESARRFLEAKNRKSTDPSFLFRMKKEM